MTTIGSSTFLLAIFSAPGWGAFLLDFGILGVVDCSLPTVGYFAEGLAARN